MEEFKAAYYDLLKKNTELNARLDMVTDNCNKGKKLAAEYIDDITRKLDDAEKSRARLTNDIRVMAVAVIPNQEIARVLLREITLLEEKYGVVRIQGGVNHGT